MQCFGHSRLTWRAVDCWHRAWQHWGMRRAVAPEPQVCATSPATNATKAVLRVSHAGAMGTAMHRRLSRRRRTIFRVAPPPPSRERASFASAVLAPACASMIRAYSALACGAVLRAWRGAVSDARDAERRLLANALASFPALAASTAMLRWQLCVADAHRARNASAQREAEAVAHFVHARLSRWRRLVRQARAVSRKLSRRAGAGLASHGGARGSLWPAAATGSAAGRGGRAAHATAIGGAALALAFRARALLRHWRTAVDDATARAELLANAVVYGGALRVSSCLLRWRRLARRSRGLRRRRFRAYTFYARRLQRKVWRGWMVALVECRCAPRAPRLSTRAPSLLLRLGPPTPSPPLPCSTSPVACLPTTPLPRHPSLCVWRREQRRTLVRRQWARAGACFALWAEQLHARTAASRARRTAVSHHKRALLRRGSAALRRRAVEATTRELARAAARGLRQRRRTRQASAALACWAIATGSEFRRRATALAAELQLRGELLAQARAANAAAEDEMESCRTRADSLAADVSALHGVLEEHRREAEDASRELAQADERTAAVVAEKVEVEERLAEAHATAERWRSEAVELRGRLDEMAAGHERERDEGLRRREALQDEVAERSRLLQQSQAALHQTSSQLNATATEGGEKLRSALEVATSLRAMLSQKEGALQTASVRERRQNDLIRQLEAKAKGMHAQISEMRDGEARQTAELHSARASARRQDARMATLSEALRESHQTLEELRAAGSAPRRRHTAGGAAGGAAGGSSGGRPSGSGTSTGGVPSSAASSGPPSTVASPARRREAHGGVGAAHAVPSDWRVAIQSGAVHVAHSAGSGCDAAAAADSGRAANTRPTAARSAAAQSAVAQSAAARSAAAQSAAAQSAAARSAAAQSAVAQSAAAETIATARAAAASTSRASSTTRVMATAAAVVANAAAQLGGGTPLPAAALPSPSLAGGAPPWGAPTDDAALGRSSAALPSAPTVWPPAKPSAAHPLSRSLPQPLPPTAAEAIREIQALQAELRPSSAHQRTVRDGAAHATPTAAAVASVVATSKAASSAASAAASVSAAELRVAADRAAMPPPPPPPPMRASTTAFAGSHPCAPSPYQRPTAASKQRVAATTTSHARRSSELEQRPPWQPPSPGPDAPTVASGGRRTGLARSPSAPPITSPSTSPHPHWQDARSPTLPTSTSTTSLPRSASGPASALPSSPPRDALGAPPPPPQVSAPLEGFSGVRGPDPEPAAAPLPLGEDGAHAAAGESFEAASEALSAKMSALAAAMSCELPSRAHKDAGDAALGAARRLLGNASPVLPAAARYGTCAGAPPLPPPTSPAPPPPPPPPPPPESASGATWHASTKDPGDDMLAKYCQFAAPARYDADAPPAASRPSADGGAPDASVGIDACAATSVAALDGSAHAERSPLNVEILRESMASEQRQYEQRRSELLQAYGETPTVAPQPPTTPQPAAAAAAPRPPASAASSAHAAAAYCASADRLGVTLSATGALPPSRGSPEGWREEDFAQIMGFSLLEPSETSPTLGSAVRLAPRLAVEASATAPIPIPRVSAAIANAAPAAAAPAAATSVAAAPISNDNRAVLPSTAATPLPPAQAAGPRLRPGLGAAPRTAPSGSPTRVDRLDGEPIVGDTAATAGGVVAAAAGGGVATGADAAVAVGGKWATGADAAAAVGGGVATGADAAAAVGVVLPACVPSSGGDDAGAGDGRVSDAEFGAALFSLGARLTTPSEPPTPQVAAGGPSGREAAAASGSGGATLPIGPSDPYSESAQAAQSLADRILALQAKLHQSVDDHEKAASSPDED